MPLNVITFETTATCTRKYHNRNTALTDKTTVNAMYRVTQKRQPIHMFVKSTFLQISTPDLVRIVSNDGQIMPQSYKAVATGSFI